MGYRWRCLRRRPNPRLGINRKEQLTEDERCAPSKHDFKQTDGQEPGRFRANGGEKRRDCGLQDEDIPAPAAEATSMVIATTIPTCGAP